MLNYLETNDQSDYYDEYADAELSNDEPPTEIIKHAEEYFKDDYYNGTND